MYINRYLSIGCTAVCCDDGVSVWQLTLHCTEHWWPGAPPHPRPGLHPRQYWATLPPHNDLPEVTDIWLTKFIRLIHAPIGFIPETIIFYFSCNFIIGQRPPNTGQRLSALCTEPYIMQDRTLILMKWFLFLYEYSTVLYYFIEFIWLVFGGLWPIMKLQLK